MPINLPGLLSQVSLFPDVISIVVNATTVKLLSWCACTVSQDTFALCNKGIVTKVLWRLGKSNCSKTDIDFIDMVHSLIHFCTKNQQLCAWVQYKAQLACNAISPSHLCQVTHSPIRNRRQHTGCSLLAFTCTSAAKPAC